MLSVLLLGFGSAMAATSAFENLPGGASVSYFECNNGWESLINIQNTTSETCGDSPIVVHVTMYDQNSVDILDFDVPLSARDNWGASITCDGVNITSTPSLPVWFSGGTYTGAEVRSAPFAGNFGYIVTTVTGVDRCDRTPITPFGTCQTQLPRLPIGPPGTNVCDAAHYNDGDPRNDTLTGVDAYLPDSMFMRTALINVGQGVAYALNAQMVQGFANIAVLNETAAPASRLLGFNP